MAKVKRSAVPAIVGTIMGSKSDWPTMEVAARFWTSLELPYEVAVVSAHRTPTSDGLCGSAKERGLRHHHRGCGRGGALPGMVRIEDEFAGVGCAGEKSSAQWTRLVCCPLRKCPQEFPSQTFASVKLVRRTLVFCASILALKDSVVAQKLDKFRTAQDQDRAEGPDPRK